MYIVLVGLGFARRRGSSVELGLFRVCSSAVVVGGARVRSRCRSPMVVVGGARLSREGVPLRLVFRGDDDEAKAAALRGIMIRLLFAPMVLHSGATGEFGSCCTGVRAWISVAWQVMWFLPLYFKDARYVVGAAVDGRLDLA